MDSNERAPEAPLVRFTRLPEVAHERELERLRDLPRRTPTTTSLLGKPLAIVDAESFLWTVPDVIERQMYRFPSSRARPSIIDGGANVGLSCLFFKSIYPQAHIRAFEPDPDCFAALEENLRTWNCCDVELYQAALWSESGRQTFYRDGADAGRLGPIDGASVAEVQTHRLRDYLDAPVDMLKLDIEGAETRVIVDCQDRLANVANIYVGYHSLAHEPQTLVELLSVLRDSGFRVHLEGEKLPGGALCRRHEYLGMDAQVAVFGYRRAPTAW